MDRQKFARLNARLQQRPNPEETGQVLPLMETALELMDSAERLRAVVEALAAERIIVPVDVEDHPDKRTDTAREDALPIPLAATDRGVFVFSSAVQLTAWDRGARPTPLSGQKAALTALVGGGGRLCLDPAGANLVIPRPATAALAQGDTWLPPWEDTELADELTAAARQSPGVRYAEVRLVPAPEAVDVRVEVTVSPAQPGRFDRAQMEALLATLAGNVRLKAATDRIEFVPRLLPLV